MLSQDSEQMPPTAPSDTPRRHAGNAPYRLLDAWRGFAALWVVMLHVSLVGIPAPIYAFSQFGLLGVPMFFVISGYCIASAAVRSLNAPQPVAHFLRARVRRIYPPYILASLVAAGLSAALSLLIRRHVLPSSQLADLDIFHQPLRFYVAALTLTQVPLHTPFLIRVFWSLCYEAAFYAVVAALLLAALRINQTPRLLDALGVVTLGALLWLNLRGEACPFPWNLWPQFGFGVLVYQLLAQPERRWPRVLFLLCGALLIVFAARHEYRGVLDPQLLTVRTGFSLAFAVVLLALFRWDGVLTACRPLRLFSSVGLFSYSLYLIHLLALGVVTQGVQRMAVLAAHPLPLYLVKIAVCLLIGRLFFHVCERPFLNTRQRQARRETPPVATGGTGAT